MKIVAVMNQKGGVGKTTTVVTLGHGLALAGKRVLVVDLDGQGNVADSLGLEKDAGLYELLVEGAGARAVRARARAGLDVVPGNKRTVEARQILAGQAFREQVLGRKVRDLAGYDVALLDVAPGIDLLQISAFVAADAFLIPVALDHLAVVGVGDALASAGALREAGGLGGRFLGVLPTFWERITSESQEQLELLSRQFGRMVWEPIPRDTKAREAAAHGQTLYEFAPGCRALMGVALGDDYGLLGGYRRALMRLLQEVEL